ncbi:leucine-rich repeat domain-containing protein [Culicoidibacter larvae]|nr:leucine-rich repeat domain-containing protein [Culicoidibacter larvae]
MALFKKPDQKTQLEAIQEKLMQTGQFDHSLFEAAYNSELPAKIELIYKNPIIAKEIARQLRRTVSDVVAANDLSAITTLDLSNKGITDISDDDFKYLNQLQHLYLQKNQLQVVPNFSTITNLLTLDLSNNLLTEIPDFDHLNSLQELYLNGNQLRRLPSFRFLKQLQRLAADRNRLVAVPAFNLPNLISLSLHTNMLSEVPIITAHNLQVLYLYGNHLTSVPGLNQMVQLQDFEVANQKAQFPAVELNPDENLYVKLPIFQQLRNLDAQPAIKISLNNGMTKLPVPTRLIDGSIEISSQVLREGQQELRLYIQDISKVNGNWYYANNWTSEYTIPVNKQIAIDKNDETDNLEDETMKNVFNKTNEVQVQEEDMNASTPFARRLLNKIQGGAKAEVTETEIVEVSNEADTTKKIVIGSVAAATVAVGAIAAVASFLIFKNNKKDSE